MWYGLLYAVVVALLIFAAGWVGFLWLRSPPPVRRSTIFKAPITHPRSGDAHRAREDLLPNGAHQTTIRTGRRPFTPTQRTPLLGTEFQVPTASPTDLDQTSPLETFIEAPRWYVPKYAPHPPFLALALCTTLFWASFRLNSTFLTILPHHGSYLLLIGIMKLVRPQQNPHRPLQFLRRRALFIWKLPISKHPRRQNTTELSRRHRPLPIRSQRDLPDLRRNGIISLSNSRPLQPPKITSWSNSAKKSQCATT